MLASIQFDDNAMLDGSKVNDVRSDRNLAAKLGVVKAATTQQKPNGTFGIR